MGSSQSTSKTSSTDDKQRDQSAGKSTGDKATEVTKNENEISFQSVKLANVDFLISSLRFKQVELKFVPARYLDCNDKYYSNPAACIVQEDCKTTLKTLEESFRHLPFVLQTTNEREYVLIFPRKVPLTGPPCSAVYLLTKRADEATADVRYLDGQMPNGSPVQVDVDAAKLEDKLGIWQARDVIRPGNFFGSTIHASTAVLESTTNGKVINMSMYLTWWSNNDGEEETGPYICTPTRNNRAYWTSFDDKPKVGKLFTYRILDDRTGVFEATDKTHVAYRVSFTKYMTLAYANLYDV